MSHNYFYKTLSDILIAQYLSFRCRGLVPAAVLTGLRQLNLCRKNEFEPVEAFRLGFFHTDFNAASLTDFVSRRTTTHLQEILNPPLLAPLFRNKAVFYRRCIDMGLQIPRLYGLFSHRGRRLHILRDGVWLPVTDNNAFVATLPERFAVKPVDGSLGEGFRIVSRNHAGFKDNTGSVYDNSGLLSLFRRTSSTGTLIQEVLENHSDITALSGTAGLQTVRLITLVGADDKVEILLAFFKTITSPAVVIDTLIEDMTGNLEAVIDPQTGALTTACYLDGGGRGIVSVSAHPITGKPFKGFLIPYWPQVCQLAYRAALAALPMRTIGWDIAITADGPCLIEGNIWWNPPNQHLAMQRISQRLEAVIAELT